MLGVREMGRIGNMATEFDTPTLGDSCFLVQSYDQAATHNLSGKYCGLLLTFKTSSGLTAGVKTPSLIQININLSSDSTNINLTSLVNASKIRYKNGSDGTWSEWV